jgi:processive 1,2-diacylglycerol beta-glucosyltransferase
VTRLPRILIFYAEAGAGHRRAAEAIAQPLLAHSATVVLHDALRFTHPLFRAVYAGGGLGLITHLPRLYQLAYNISDQPSVDRVLRGPRYRTQQISTRALRRTIDSFQPDAIICTHYLAAELCAGWRRSDQLRVPLYTVITDFDPHFMWQHAGTDGYCVPTEAARDRLVHDGIDPAIITVTGIPIDPRFAAPPDRLAAARRLAIDPDRPVVLIMGGGLGVGLMGSIAQALRAQPLEAQIVFITGQNHTLRRQLKALSLSQKERWSVRGFVANMPDWLAVADVAISKAGGLSGSELLAAGVPTIVPCWLTGHEALNAQYLESTGAALLVATAGEGVAEADRLLHQPQTREAMHCAALYAARPDAATLIADRILNSAAVTHHAPRTTSYVDHPSLSTR